MGQISEPQQTDIAGVWTLKLAEIHTNGGPVLHMLRSDQAWFSSFGEIYFSVVEAGAVKAWKRHKLQAQNLAVPAGLLRLVIYDNRPDSPSKGRLQEFKLGRPGHYSLLHIPHGLWYGFTAQGPEAALIANCADLPHTAEEAEKIPPDSAVVPYSW